MTNAPSIGHLFFSVQIDKPPFQWLSVEFSFDGLFILLQTDQNTALLLDAYTGVLLQEYQVLKGVILYSICFSPDAQFVLGGTSAGSIIIWRTKDGVPLVQLWGHHRGVTALKWAPNLMLIASGDTHLGLWTPP